MLQYTDRHRSQIFAFFYPPYKVKLNFETIYVVIGHRLVISVIDFTDDTLISAFINIIVQVLNALLKLIPLCTLPMFIDNRTTYYILRDIQTSHKIKVILTCNYQPVALIDRPMTDKIVHHDNMFN